MVASSILQAKHVSAATLNNMIVPRLSQHNTLSTTDKEIWDAAYREEYKGLLNLPCWRTITEEDYQQLHPHIGFAIPTCAISTIKYDEIGLPKRAKYRIIALGNLDPHPWTKGDVSTPVMNHSEICKNDALKVKLSYLRY